MKVIIIMCVCLLFSGCVSFQTGLQLAQFGVSVGFDIHNYVEAKKEESKQIIQESEKSWKNNP